MTTARSAVHRKDTVIRYIVLLDGTPPATPPSPDLMGGIMQLG